MTHQDWTDRLRDRMADYEAAAPEGLWADIEQSLPQQKAHITPLWRRWVSRAAVVALLIGTGWWLWPETEVKKAIEEAVVSRPHASKSVIPYEKPTSLIAQAVSAVVSRAPIAIIHETTEDDDDVAVIHDDAEQPAASSSEESPKPLPSVPVSTKAEPSLPITPPIKKKAQHISVGLYANNGLLAYQHSNGVQMSDDMAKRYDYSEYMPTRASSPNDPIYLTGYEERQHHDHPISFGLTVAYPLSKHWTLETGLVYTRLHSTFTNIMQQTQISKEQTLHYLGIPLHIQYLLLNNKQWKVYAKTGTQVDWNFRAKYEIEGVDTQMEKDYAQWSLGAAVGLEYDIIPSLGLYAEPGFRYHFDNGSKVQNFFKDKPASWSLQLGIRLRLSQR